MINPINALIIGQAVRINGTNEVATVINAIANNGYGKSVVVVQYRADSVHRGASQGFDPEAVTLVAYPHVETVISRALAAGTKITDQHVAASKTLQAVAAYFVLTYKGTNGFVQSVCDFAFTRGYLSIGQARGVLNVMIADAREASERAAIPANAFAIDFASVDAQPAPAAMPAAQPALPNGIYTVFTADGGHTTIRLADAPADWKSGKGAQVAAFLSGSDNDSDYTGCAFVNGRMFTMFKKYRVTAHKLIAALRELLASDDNGFTAGRAYALRSGKCYVCNRTLTTPESITAGIGPVCADKLGIDTAAILAEVNAQRERSRQALAGVDELFS